jgi:peptidoglycan-N-acetylglucosamine deacetylase
LQPCYGLIHIPEQFKIAQVVKTKILLEKYGLKNKCFRFPGGCASTTDVALVNKLGLEVVQWDVIGSDGDAINADIIVHRVMNQVKNGSIIVLHSHGGPKVRFTDSALRTIIPALLKRGFQFVKLEELPNNH